MAEGRLPELIVIGAMKAGTTSLHAYLGCHPDIFMSKEKELNFFDGKTNWDKGIDWYKSNFISSKKITGESSPSYSKKHTDFDVPKRIFEFIPDVKLIYIVRDPIERTLSHIYEYYYAGGQERDINKFILSEYKKGTLQDTHIVRTSMYYFQIEEYLKYFNPDQIYVVSLEDLNAEKLETMNKIFAFLGLETLDNDSIFNFSENRSYQKKMFNSFTNNIRKSAINKGIKHVLPKTIYNKLAKSKFVTTVGKKKISKINLSPDSENALKEIFKEDVSLFKALTNKNFYLWKTY